MRIRFRPFLPGEASVIVIFCDDVCYLITFLTGSSFTETMLGMAWSKPPIPLCFLSLSEISCFTDWLYFGCIIESSIELLNDFPIVSCRASFSAGDRDLLGEIDYLLLFVFLGFSCSNRSISCWCSRWSLIASMFSLTRLSCFFSSYVCCWIISTVLPWTCALPFLEERVACICYSLIILRRNLICSVSRISGLVMSSFLISP